MAERAMWKQFISELKLEQVQKKTVHAVCTDDVVARDAILE